MPDQSGIHTLGARELYAGCASSDPELQSAAFRALGEYLYRVALYMLQGQVEAEALAQDCAQIALIRVCERLADCREPAAFQAWSRRIAANTVNDELRRRRRVQPLADDEDEDNLSTRPAIAEYSLETSVLDQVEL